MIRNLILLCFLPVIHSAEFQDPTPHDLLENNIMGHLAGFMLDGEPNGDGSVSVQFVNGKSVSVDSLSGDSIEDVVLRLVESVAVLEEGQIQDLFKFGRCGFSRIWKSGCY